MHYNQILLCGLRNTGKTTTFWQLQKQLNWPTFSVSQFLRDYIRTLGLQGSSNSDLSEHEEVMRHEIMDRVTKLLMSQNPVIVETRVLENIHTDFPNCLKVLLTASKEVRIRRNAFRESISQEKSAQRLIKKENKWLEKVSAQFGRSDFFEPKYYQLVIETDELTNDQVVEKILSALSEPQ